ncbi:MAG: glycosyltransferase family 4 protein [Planctomycetes bacterium]|nr:glycosyltransferase family 4 protein [Planctomycetota bacterium]
MILLLNRSFHPDTEATGQFLTDLAAELAKSTPVTALCGRPYGVQDGFRGWRHVERHRGVRIIRVRHTRLPKAHFWGRLANWASYLSLTLLAALRERPRWLFVHTDPPLLGTLALALRRLHRCGIVYSVQDIYPDVAEELGVLRRAWITRLFDAANRRALREAHVIVALGRDMAARLAAKGIPDAHIRVIPHWVDTSAIRPVPAEDNEYLRDLGLQDRFVFMYSGNIGMTQDFDAFLDALSRVETDRSTWALLFAGGGAARARVEERVRALGLSNAVFLATQPREKLATLLSAGTLHLVPMKKGLAGCVVPSKIYGIMAAGRPYLALSDAECDMAGIAREEGCGLWSPAGDVDAARKQLEWAIAHRAEVEAMGRRGRALAETRYDAPLVLRRWVELFEEISPDRI